MQDAEAKAVLNEIRKIAKTESEDVAKQYVRIIPATVISISGLMATVRLSYANSDGSQDFTAYITTQQTVSIGDSVNVAYWINLSTAIIISNTSTVSSGGSGGTADYSELTNKPQINSVELSGNKTSTQLSLYGTGNEPPYPVNSVDGNTGAVVLSDVKYTEQTLTDSQKTIARTNIGAGTSSFSGSYTDLTNQPTIPTKTSQITNDSDFQTGTQVSASIATETTNRETADTSLQTQITTNATNISNKVDKETGKGLSTNDFTDTDKTKLDGIESGAQVNTITGVKGDSESSYRVGNVNITKDNIGLGNVDNTSDLNKPISKAAQTALDLKAPLASPSLTGTPTAPTATTGDNSTKLATTEFVQNTVSAVSGGVASFNGRSGVVLPQSGDYTATMVGAQPTITGAATTITDSNLSGSMALISNTDGKVAESNVTSTELLYLSGIQSNVQQQINYKAPLYSPPLVGTPTAPTAASGTSTTQIATTQFVQNALSSAGTGTTVNIVRW